MTSPGLAGDPFCGWLSTMTPAPRGLGVFDVSAPSFSPTPASACWACFCVSPWRSGTVSRVSTVIGWLTDWAPDGVSTVNVTLNVPGEPNVDVNVLAPFDDDCGTPPVA